MYNFIELFTELKLYYVKIKLYNIRLIQIKLKVFNCEVLSNNEVIVLYVKIKISCENKFQVNIT